MIGLDKRSARAGRHPAGAQADDPIGGRDREFELVETDEPTTMRSRAMSRKIDRTLLADSGSSPAHSRQAHHSADHPKSRQSWWPLPRWRRSQSSPCDFDQVGGEISLCIGRRDLVGGLGCALVILEVVRAGCQSGCRWSGTAPPGSVFTCSAPPQNMGGHEEPCCHQGQPGPMDHKAFISNPPWVGKLHDFCLNACRNCGKPAEMPVGYHRHVRAAS
jgi:hypothetical protein